MLTRVRKLTRMIFSRSTLRIFRLPGTSIDFQREVGEPLSSSVVAAPVLWMARTFPEAPAALWKKKRTADEEEPELGHPMLRLLDRPNPFFTGVQLWVATVIEWMTAGEAFWIKVRAPAGNVVELWYAPSWMIEPRTDENASAFITHYVYTVDGVERPLPVSEVVHFRFGADPDNPRRGLSPLRSLLREIYTDQEAAQFTAALLKNMGVPGILVSPDGDVELTPDEGAETKALLKSQFGGDKRGEPIVLTSKTKVQQFGFSPEQLVLKDLRRIPEERVTAVLGVPAMVVGLGAGLDRSTFTNFGEAREAAYEGAMIPMQRLLAEDVRFQLLADFVGDRSVFDWRFGFDLTRVRVLQEDLTRLAQRHAIGLREGAETVADFRRAMGLTVSPSDNIYLRQQNLVAVPADGGEATSYAPASSNGNGNGNGAGLALSGRDAYSVAREVVEQLEAGSRLELVRRDS